MSNQVKTPQSERVMSFMRLVEALGKIQHGNFCPHVSFLPVPVSPQPWVSAWSAFPAAHTWWALPRATCPLRPVEPHPHKSYLLAAPSRHKKGKNYIQITKSAFYIERSKHRQFLRYLESIKKHQKHINGVKKSSFKFFEMKRSVTV